MNTLFALTLLLVLLALIYVLWAFVRMLLPGYVPFINVQNQIIPQIIAALELGPSSKLYDLGCGEGRVLLAAHKQVPEASFVGIEKQLLAYLMAFWKSRKVASPKFQIKRGDFHHFKIASATHVFLYLYPRVMDELLPKLERELSPGTRLVSVDFGFTNKSPEQTIDLGRTSGLGQRLLVYTF